MAKRLNPVAIKHPRSGFYSQMHVVDTKEVRLKGHLVGTEDVYRPRFDAPDETTGSQFHSREDAQALIDNPEYGGPEAFAGCTIVPVWE